jgi:single-strand DNA-binding protein
MNRSLNKVMLIGYVGKDPEFNYTASGVPVATFRLATSESWKDKDGSLKEHTDWHSVVAWNLPWRALADAVQKIVQKGSRVYVEGKIQNRSYDHKDGTKRYVTEIIADNIIVLEGGRQKEMAEAHHNGHEQKDGFDLTQNHDDVPF